MLLLHDLQELPVFVRLLSTLGDPLTLSLGTPCCYCHPHTVLTCLCPSRSQSACCSDVRLPGSAARNTDAARFPPLRRKHRKFLHCSKCSAACALQAWMCLRSSWPL
jgi:hypothetical protein